MPKKTATYRDVFLNPVEGSYYLMPMRAAEDRGGSSKPAGLIVADSLDKILTVPREGPVYQARNGGLFCIGVNEEGRQRGRLPLGVVQVVDKVFDPESSGWWSLVEDDEDERGIPRPLTTHWRTHDHTATPLAQPLIK